MNINNEPLFSWNRTCLLEGSAMSTSKASFRDAYRRVRRCVSYYDDTGVNGLRVASSYHDPSRDPLVMPAVGCYKARLKEDILIERFWARADAFDLSINRQPSLHVVA